MTCENTLCALSHNVKHDNGDKIKCTDETLKTCPLRKAFLEMDKAIEINDQESVIYYKWQEIKRSEV